MRLIGTTERFLVIDFSSLRLGRLANKITNPDENKVREIFWFKVSLKLLEESFDHRPPITNLSRLLFGI